MKKYIILSALTVCLVVLVAGVYGYLHVKNQATTTINNEINEVKISHEPCLSDDEAAEYEIKEKKRSLGDTEGMAIIYIRDKTTNKIKYSFEIDSVWVNYHPAEIHNCGIYVVRMLNYNHNELKQDAGYKDELWKYGYNQQGNALVLFSEKPKEFISYYSPDFRIDPDEKYVVLERGYLGKDGYALVIKDLKTLKDTFVLTYDDLAKQNPWMEGSYFQFRNWTQDGKYLWLQMQMVATARAFIRIEKDTWKTDVLATPAGTGGGTALNAEKGYITHNDGPGWIGIDVVSQQIEKEWKAQSKKVTLYLYNLFTKKSISLATVDEPLWTFWPKWLSDTELQYELPNGEIKIHTIDEK